MTNNFGFMAQAQRKIEAMQAEAAKVAEASKTLVSIRKDLGIGESNYLDSMDKPLTEEQFRIVAERQLADLQGYCYGSQYLQDLGLQGYLDKELSMVYQSALKLAEPNPNFDPVQCIGYIERLTSPETIEHVDSFGRELCDAMFRSMIVMAFELEISNVRELMKKHQAEVFRNYMETKVVEQEKLIPCSEF